VSSINADNGVVSGITGVRVTADSTGNLALQSNGVTVLTLATNNTATFANNVTVTGTLTTASQGISYASLPAGSILQVVNTDYTGTASSTSATPANVSGFSATITPKFSTSKILVTVCTNFGFNSDSGGGGDPYPYILLLRNGTSIGTGVNATGAQINTFLSGPALPGNLDVKSKYKYLPATRMFLDSPANTSALTYQIQLAQPFSGALGYLNRQADTDNNSYIQSVASSITLMEVAA
jgi:hypothetical protein